MGKRSHLVWAQNLCGKSYMNGIALPSLDVWPFIPIAFSFGTSAEMDKEMSNLL